MEDGRLGFSSADRRRHPRYIAKDRALVAITGDTFGLPYHLVDISEGGMAFRYLGDGPFSMQDIQMDLYLDDTLFVDRLPVSVVADKEIESEFLPKRRRSVRFGPLTTPQKRKLLTFILNHTHSAVVFEASPGSNYSLQAFME